MNVKYQLDLYFVKISNYLLNFNISTGAPDLRTFKTIPAEGQDVISWREVLRNFNQILESPIIRAPGFFRKVYFGPFWPFWCCPYLRRDQVHGDPTPLEVLRFGNPRFPIDPGSFPLILYLIQNTSEISWRYIDMLLRQLSYAIKKQLKAPKAPF